MISFLLATAPCFPTLWITSRFVFDMHCIQYVRQSILWDINPIHLTHQSPCVFMNLFLDHILSFVNLAALPCISAANPLQIICGGDRMTTKDSPMSIRACYGEDVYLLEIKVVEMQLQFT